MHFSEVMKLILLIIGFVLSRFIGLESVRSANNLENDTKQVTKVSGNFKTRPKKRKVRTIQLDGQKCEYGRNRLRCNNAKVSFRHQYLSITNFQ